MTRKKLPIGIQTFSKIRKGGEDDYYYVDKTPFIARLIDAGAVHHFLSRPRRFGKSMLVDTLKNLFGGKEELFRGLYIHDKWDWTKEYPVLHFSFAKGTFKIPGYLERNLAGQLAALERKWEMESDIPDAPDRLAYLIERLVKEKGQPVVILVDEYDKPIFDTLGTPDLSRDNRDTLSGFYGTLKDCEEDIQFSFLTGVTKFAHAGIFSGLNNLVDITLEPEFSSICGYTDHDIDTVFASELEKQNPEKLDREKIREWYNGYSWCGDEKVYNPFSILQLFRKRKFKDWWFRTGTPTFLIDELKKLGGIDILELTGKSAGDELLSSVDIGDIEVPALLFQTGYLTIARVDESGGEELYQLDYPNREVRQSLYQKLLRVLAPKLKVPEQAKQLRDALLSHDLNTVQAQLHAAFSGIPGPGQWDTVDKIARYEAHYATAIYFYFMGTGLVVRPEDPTSKGRIDMTVETNAGIYIFEFKVLREGVKSGAALKQLRDRGYADKYRARGVPVYLVGVEFDPKERNIELFDYEPVRGRRTSGRKKSARKKVTRKKSGGTKRTRKKSTRKKGARKKAARKKRSRKKSTRKKSSRKKVSRKKSARKKAARKKRSSRR